MSVLTISKLKHWAEFQNVFPNILSLKSSPNKIKMLLAQIWIFFISVYRICCQYKTQAAKRKLSAVGWFRFMHRFKVTILIEFMNGFIKSVTSNFTETLLPSLHDITWCKKYKKKSAFQTLFFFWSETIKLSYFNSTKSP